LTAKFFVRITRIIGTIALLFFFALTINGQEEGTKHERHRKLWQLLATLSSADRQKYSAARKQALANAEVAAADKRRQQAELEYRKLLRQEMLKTDPSLAPLLDQLAELRRREDF
jgi:hypothetical protein